MTRNKRSLVARISTKHIYMIYKLVFIPKTSADSGDKSEIPTISIQICPNLQKLFITLALEARAALILKLEPL